MKHRIVIVVQDRDHASPPVRGRGLKRYYRVFNVEQCESPPVRGRGLKRWNKRLLFCCLLVAPRAGAWIETFLSPDLRRRGERRPPCGGVD